MSLSSQLPFLIGAGFFAGFVDAVAGGGGLISLPALLALGLPPQLALGTNKMIGISTALASTIRYSLSGIVERSIWPALLLGVSFGACGAAAASISRSTVLRPIILVGLVLVGIYLIVRRQFGQHEAPKDRPKHPIWMKVAIAAIGFYDGFFGPGTGTFLMVGFVSLMGFSLLKASAHGRIVNLSTNLGALLVFSYWGFVDVRLALPAALASFTGGILGASWALRYGSKGIRPVFLCVTWLLIAKVAYDVLS